MQRNVSYSGVDYTVNGQSFQFVPTAEQLAVSLDIIEDMLVEGVEDLMLSLTSPAVGGQPHAGVLLGTQQITQILIEDNDGELHCMVVEPKAFLGVLRWTYNGQ